MTSVNSNDRSLVDVESFEWVIIENYVYDVSKIRHPKGQYILSQCSGMDITRELYGLKSYYYQSAGNEFVKKEKH